VASHGQTIWHVPRHSTWQLGEAAVIAERVGRPVIADFRVRDMAAGGQGAPLVPMADCLLFSAPHWRALQNIGGIGNVSVVPPNGGVVGVRAFDTGPGVVVMDGVTRALVPGMRFDPTARWPGRARRSRQWSRWRFGDPYFAAPPPKSTGRTLLPTTSPRSSHCRTAHPAATASDIIARPCA
jgi:anhydro-N-acetylmuramic acid kinase